MKFVFNYERLLMFYHQQEEIARRDHMESLSKLEDEKANYQKMWGLHDDAHTAIFDLRKQASGAPLARLVQLDQFIDGQKLRISRQREVVINHTAIVEQKQEILISAVKERKILEKLKERRLDEFKKGVLKKERKANDELVVTRFKRREGA